ncbi:MAG: antitoxin [Angustibacter sp.]
MGMFDKAKDLAAGQADKLEGVSDAVVEKVGDAVDKVTGDKFADKVDAAQEAADSRIGE